MSTDEGYFGVVPEDVIAEHIAPLLSEDAFGCLMVALCSPRFDSLRSKCAGKRRACVALPGGSFPPGSVAIELELHDIFAENDALSLVSRCPALEDLTFRVCMAKDGAISPSVPSLLSQLSSLHRLSISAPLPLSSLSPFLRLSLSLPSLARLEISLDTATVCHPTSHIASAARPEAPQQPPSAGTASLGHFVREHGEGGRVPCRLSTLVLRGSFEGSVLDGDGKEPASGSGTREESGGRKDGGRGESSGEEGGQQEDKAKREERGAARALGAGSGAGETSVTLDDVVGAAAETLRALVVERSTVDAADWAIRAARGLQALTRLSLAGTPVPESVLAPLDGHPSLRELVLSGDPSKTVSDRLTWSDCAATLPTISSLSCLCLADRRGLRAGGAVEGLEWMCALTGLRSLSLGGVGGVGNAAAAAIGALTGLEALDLSMAKRVSDTGLLAVSCLTRLSALRLDGCERVSDAGLRAVAPALPCLANLSVARLPRLTDDGLSSFAGAPLTRLCVADCRRVSGYGLRGLCPDGTLQIADMESCAAMSDLGLLWLSRQTALRSVNLYWCQRVSDDGVAALGALRGLTSLCLRGCVLRMLCGDQPHDFESCDKLTSRGVSSAISGSSSALLDLSLAGISGLTDDISSALRALTSLTRLVLYGCENVGDPTVRALAAMPSLRYLNLKGCRGVSSESVAWLRGRVRVWGKRGTLLLDARCDPDRSAST